MSDAPKLAEVKVMRETNLQDVAATLEKIAAGIRSGSYGQVKQATVVMLTGRGLEVFGLGAVEATDVHYLLAGAQQKMVDPLLEYKGGDRVW